jgi:hypothetical protein
MRKLLPFLVAGLAAASFSAFAADTQVDANTKIKGNTNTEATGARAGTGASTDEKTDKSKRKVGKHKAKSAGAGATKEKSEAATEKHDKRDAANPDNDRRSGAPAGSTTAPAPTDTPKKAD